MAVQRVTEVLVAETFVGDYTDTTTGYSGDNSSGYFTGGASATLFDVTGDLAAGEIAMVNPDTMLGVVLGAVPNRFMFAVYHPERGTRFSEVITKGRVGKYRYKAYEAAKPLSIKFSGFAAPVIGDTLTLTLEYRSNKEQTPMKKPITYKMNSTVLATELAAFAAEINAAAAKSYLIDYKMGATSTATELVVFGFPVTVRYNKLVEPHIVYFDALMQQSYKLSTNVTKEGWTQDHPSIAKTLGYQAGTFNPVTNLWSGVWTNANASDGTGSPEQVRDMLYRMDFGYQGSLSRITYPEAPFDPILSTSTYDMFAIEFTDPILQTGQPGNVSAHKAIHVAIPANSDFKGVLDEVMLEYGAQ